VQTLAEVIAANIRASRLALRVDADKKTGGVSQDELAGVLRHFGLEWTRNNVAYAESGKYEPPLSELVVLACALGVNLDGLLRTESPTVWLNDVTAISGDDARNLLAGRFVDIDRPNYPLEAEVLENEVKWLSKTLGITPERASELGIRAPSVAVREMVDEEAVKYLAAHLGLDPLEVALLALKLWRQSLTKERDEQAGPGANAMKKAHVTRRLKKEIVAAAVEVGWLEIPEEE